MGDRITAPTVAICIPDKRLTFANSTATPTQAGPKPGKAEAASADAKLDPRVSGGQDTDLDLYASRAGSPLRSPTADRGAAVVWSPDGGTNWNGWNAPAWIERYEALTPWSSANTFGYMDAVTVPTNQKLVVAFQQVGNINPPQVRVLDPETGLWGAAVNVKTNPAIDRYSDCAMCVLPNERLLFIQVYDDDNATAGAREFWNVHFSDDDAATWALASSNPFRSIDTLLGTPVVSGVSAVTCRMVSDKQGNVLFVRQVNDGTGKAIQYASSNAGMNFTQVSGDWTTDAPIHINLLRLHTGELALVSREGNAVIFRKIGSVFEPLEGATAATVAGSVAADAVSAWAEPDGTLWVTVSASGLVRLYQSINDGATWNEAAASFPSIPYRAEVFGGTAGQYLPQAAVHAVDGPWVFGNSIDTGGGTTYDGMVTACRLGGFTDLEVPLSFDNSADAGRAFLPLELPGTNPELTEITSGGTAVLTAPGMMRVTTSVQTFYWVDVAPGTTWGTVLHDFHGVIDIQVQSGGSTAAVQCGLAIDNGDGANRGSAFLTFSTSGGATTYAVLDGITPRGTFSPGVTGRLQVRYYYDGRNQTFSTWYRAHTATVWTQGHAAVTITPIPSGGTTALTWGHIASTTCQADWYMHKQDWTKDTGSWDPPDALADYRGKSITTLPYPIPGIGPPERVAYLALKGGPAVLAETFLVATGYDHGVERVFPALHPSPEAKWRSTDTTETVVHEFSPSPAGEYQTSLGNTTLFVYGEGINYPTMLLKGSKDGGATFPTTIGTFDATVGTAIPLKQYGEDAYEADDASSGSHARYAWFGELVGGTLVVAGTKYRRIPKNTEGPFNCDDVTRNARVWMEDIDGTEPATTTADLWAPRGVAVFHNIAGGFDRYRLVIPAGTTAEGYYEAGNILIGAVHPAGRAWEYGFVTDYRPNSETETDRAMVNRVRRNGKVKRSQTFGWPTPLNMTEFRKAAPNPNYLAADTGPPLAVVDDVPFWLAGVLEEIGSGETPVVVLWNMPLTDATETDPTIFMGATMASSVGVEHATGREKVNELLRVSRITATEL